MSKINKYFDSGEITAIRNVAALRENNSEVRALQDLLFYAIKGVSMYAHRCRELFAIDRIVDRFVEKALSETFALRNVEASDIEPLLREALETRARAKVLYEWARAPYETGPSELKGPANYEFDLHPYNIEVQAQIIAFEKKLKAGSSTNVYLEDVCLMELNDLLGRAKSCEIKDLSSDAVYGLAHEVLNLLAGNPTTKELNSLADRLAKYEVKSFAKPKQKTPEYNRSTAEIGPIHEVSSRDSSELRPTRNIRRGEKRLKLGQTNK